MTGGFRISLAALLVCSVGALVAGLTILVGARAGETWVGVAWTIGGAVLAYMVLVTVRGARSVR